MLTVTLPVYNGMPYLPEAIESVLSQSYTDFELVIVNDGSTDGSEDYLRSLEDSRISLFSRSNRGLGYTLNQLFDSSASEYVARMDSDDVCEPSRLAKQIAFLREHKDVVVVGTGISFLSGSGTVTRGHPPCDPVEIRRRLLQSRPGLYHPTIVVKRSAWQSVGGYRIKVAGEDLDFLLRLSEVGRAANIPESLYRYRIHHESLSLSRQDELRCGYAYAVRCARARDSEQPEPQYEDFSAAWEQRGRAERLMSDIESAAERLYRRSLIMSAQKRPMRSALYLLGAAACDPMRGLRRLSGH